MSTMTQIGTDSGGGFLRPRVFSGFDGDDDRGRRLLHRYRLGLALFIAAIAMLFVGFSSAYVVRRDIPTYDAATGTYSTIWEPLRLPVALLLLNTVLLLGASISLEIVRRLSRKASIMGGEREPHRVDAALIYSSFSLLLLFIAGQGFVWRVMQHEQALPSTGARTAFFYVLSGTHAFHALIGLVVVGWIALRLNRWPAVRHDIAIDLTAWYLHSMTTLWIYLLCILLFA
jgi:cytochrome c oxidase subunit 3